MVTDVAEKVYSKNQKGADGPILANSVKPTKVVAVVSNCPPKANAFPEKETNETKERNRYIEEQH